MYFLSLIFILFSVKSTYPIDTIYKSISYHHMIYYIYKYVPPIIRARLGCKIQNVANSAGSKLNMHFFCMLQKHLSVDLRVSSHYCKRFLKTL